MGDASFQPDVGEVPGISSQGDECLRGTHYGGGVAEVPHEDVQVHDIWSGAWHRLSTWDGPGRLEGIAVQEVEPGRVSLDAERLHVGVETTLFAVPAVGSACASVRVSTFVAAVDTDVAGHLPRPCDAWFPALLGDGCRDFFSPEVPADWSRRGVVFFCVAERIFLADGKHVGRVGGVVHVQDEYAAVLRKASVKLVTCSVYRLCGRLRAELRVTASCLPCV
jgi:hypothetical protein